METMKALAMTGLRQIEVIDVDRPRITDDEVLTKTLYTSISPGSYLQRFTGTDTRLTEGMIAYPFVTGYLNVGQVVEAGRNVKDFAVGDILNVLCFVRPTSCTFYNGSDAEYQAVQVKDNPRVIKLTGDPRHSAFSVIGTVGLSVTLEASPLAGQSVAVLGQGFIGLGCTRAFSLRGCTPIVTTDVMDRRLALSKVYGATDVRNAKDQTAEDILSDYPDGFDYVIESSGNAEALNDAIKLAKQRIIVASLYQHDVTVGLGGQFHHRRKSISANKAYPGTYPLSFYMVDYGCFEIEHLISDVVRPEDSQQMYEALLNDPARHLGVLVDWTGQLKERKRLWND